MRCKRCSSHAINHKSHGRDGSDGDLCDVCYWRKRAEQYATTAKVEERHLTMLEMQVGALITQREHYAARVHKLREHIAAHFPHSPFPEDCEDDDCQTCWFLHEDAQC